MAPSPKDEEARKLIAANYDKIHAGNHYEVLGIKREASEGEVKKAYFVMAKKFHPDAFSGLDLGELRPKADEIFSKITDAYNTLLDADKRKHYNDVIDGKVMAEDKALEEANRAIRSEMEFQKGEICMKAGNFDEAEIYFRNAIKLKPEEGDFWAYLGWAVFKKRKGDPAVNQMKGKAYLKKSLEVKSECDRALTFMGYIAKTEGKAAIAYDLFRRAVASNPENKEATREVKAYDAQAARVLGSNAPAAADKDKEKDPQLEQPAEAAPVAPVGPKGKIDLKAALSQLKRREK